MKDAAGAFQQLVRWIHDEIVVARGAPGLIVGLSGTDSLVAFLAAFEAFKMEGKPHRAWGVHFAPSEDFLADHPEAEVHTWFGEQVVPWLMKRVNHEAQILIDTSIDWRQDGLRWGALGEMGAVSYKPVRRVRERDDQFWLMGTRNRSEDLLYNYSNASLACSVQPLVHLWKSEVLEIARWLGAPQIAIDMSCQADCICGRQRLPAQHIREVDLLLEAEEDGLPEPDIEQDLKYQLKAYIIGEIVRNSYKRRIPYTTEKLK